MPVPSAAVNEPLGSNVELGPMSVLNIFVVPPTAQHYLVWRNAQVRLTLVNHGEPDALTGVSSPLARSVSIQGDRCCDGTAGRVQQLPVTVDGLVPRPAGGVAVSADAVVELTCLGD